MIILLFSQQVSERYLAAELDCEAPRAGKYVFRAAIKCFPVFLSIAEVR